MRPLLFAPLLAAGLLLIAESAQSADTARAVDRGRALAQRNCSVCHAIGMRGASPNAAAPPFRDMHTRYPADALEEAFARGLLNRHPSMPQFRFLPQELTDLTAYLKSLRGRGDA